TSTCGWNILSFWRSCACSGTTGGGVSGWTGVSQTTISAKLSCAFARCAILMAPDTVAAAAGREASAASMPEQHATLKQVGKRGIIAVRQQPAPTEVRQLI